jgi:gamma-glutamylcyclotransferase (GGCT)/AIG2-like uncharacterized protein YtfP
VRQYVFGYGSLVELLRQSPTVAVLRGHRRRWQVAMDNSRDLPGYKYYVDAATGERPVVFVAFVDLAPDAGSSVNGVAFPVDAGQLAVLDARERNYERHEITDRVTPPTGGRVWAYFGTPEARSRFETGPTVVSRAYLEQIRDGFAQLGPEELRRFEESSDDPPVPIRDLRRVEL